MREPTDDFTQIEAAFLHEAWNLMLFRAGYADAQFSVLLKDAVARGLEQKRYLRAICRSESGG
jgi:hypothetical protein